MITVNTNVTAMNAARASDRAGDLLARSVERLSSGLRINSARDDSAGLAIANGQETIIRGETQARRNISDGLSMLQTAEGAMSEIVEMMQRGRELAIQAANATLTAGDRDNLQKEVNQLVSEIKRIITDTGFNSVKLLDNGGTSTDLNEKQLILRNLKASWLEQSEAMVKDYFGLQASNVDLKILLDQDIEGATAYVTGSGSPTWINLELHLDVNEFLSIDSSSNWPNQDLDQLIAHEMAHAIMAVTTNFGSFTSRTEGEMWFVEGMAQYINGEDDLLSTVAAADVAANLGSIRNYGDFSGSRLDYATGYAGVRYLDSLLQAQGTDVKAMLGFLAEDTTRTLDDYFATGVLTASDSISTTDQFVANFQANGAAYIGGLNLVNADTGAVGGADASGGTRNTTQSGVIPDIYHLTDDPLTGFNEIWPDLSQTVSISLQSSVSVNIQAGSTADDTLSFAMSGINTSALGLDVLDISVDPSTAVGIFDIGIEAIGQEMARLGALQNRFQSALANASIKIENTSASKSRIADADYAAEVAALTRQQILTQASTAMIAQAGASNQLALQLLS